MARRLSDKEIYEDTLNRLNDRLKVLNDRATSTFDRCAYQSLVESACMHLRVFVDILLDKKGDSDDVLLSNLFPRFRHDPGNQKLLVELENAYGKRNDPGKPCWILNKMVFHPTTQRFDEYDYRPVFNTLNKPINDVLNAINRSKPALTTFTDLRLCAKTSV